MKRSEIIFGLIKIPTDFLAAFLGLITAYKLRPNLDSILNVSTDLTSYQPWHEYLLSSLIGTTILLIIFAFYGMYSLKNTHKLLGEVRKVVVICCVWMMLIITYYFLIREFPFSRVVFISALVFTMLYISAGRTVISHTQKLLLKKGVGKRKILFLGQNKLLKKIYESLQKEGNYEFIGIIANSKKSQVKGLKVLGYPKEIESILENHDIDEIIQITLSVSHLLAVDILELCREKHINYAFVPDILEVHRSNITTTTVDIYPIIHLQKTPLEGWQKVIKRTYDFFIALFSIVILSPIMILTAICIKLDSRGPIIYKSKRVGQSGKLINFYKFRSMKIGAHTEWQKMVDSKENHRKDSPLMKIKNDPRVTRVGKFIRRTSIDELPQLFNVLTGQLSLVGPRAHMPEEVKKYQGHHKFALTIKPGITGLAQISGRSDLNFEDEIRLDTYYIENWSPILDLKILLKTMPVVLKGSAAD